VPHIGRQPLGQDIPHLAKEGGQGRGTGRAQPVVDRPVRRTGSTQAPAATQAAGHCWRGPALRPESSLT
jgi:hypothetical protein